MNKVNFKDLKINIVISLVCTLLCAGLLITTIEVRYYIKNRQYKNLGWHDPNTQFDPELGWSPIPNKALYIPSWGTLSSNSLGFRSPEIDHSKEQIIVLGDSVAWGFGVSDTETFPYLLDKIVARNNYQVSNLAVSGYDLGQYYLFLKKNINKFNNLKQVVLVIYVENDLASTGANFDSGKRKPLFIIKNDKLVLEHKHISKYCLRNIFSKSYLLSSLWQTKGFPSKFLSYIAGDKILSDGELTQVSITLLEQIYKLTLDHNANLLVILSPSINDFKKKSVSLLFFENLFNKLKFDGLAHIDYINVLEKKGLEELNSIYLDDGHFNKNGNLLLAETIYKHLQKELNIH